MGSSKGKLHRSLVFLAVVAFVVLVVSLACWFYFFQADRVGIAGKTKTVMLLEANPLVQPVVFGLDRVRYEHTEPVGVFGKFAGNHVRAWFQPPEGQTQIYYRKFVEAGKKQGLALVGAVSDEGALLERQDKDFFRVLSIDVVGEWNGPNRGSRYYGAICVSLEG